MCLQVYKFMCLQVYVLIGLCVYRFMCLQAYRLMGLQVYVLIGLPEALQEHRLICYQYNGLLREQHICQLSIVNCQLSIVTRLPSCVVLSEVEVQQLDEAGPVEESLFTFHYSFFILFLPLPYFLQQICNLICTLCAEEDFFVVTEFELKAHIAGDIEGCSFSIHPEPQAPATVFEDR